MEQIRSFLGSSGPTALFDLPWMPIYLVICFLMHPLIGWITAIAMMVLALSTVLTDVLTRRLTKKVSLAQAMRNGFGEAAHRNAETIAAMGTSGHGGNKWNDAHSRYIFLQRRVTNVTGAKSAFSKLTRALVQSGALALRAYLVINGELSGGMILASNVLVGSALAPAEQVIGNWRNMLAALQGWQRLMSLFALARRAAAHRASSPGLDNCRRSPFRITTRGTADNGTERRCCHINAKSVNLA